MEVTKKQNFSEQEVVSLVNRYDIMEGRVNALYQQLNKIADNHQAAIDSKHRIQNQLEAILQLLPAGVVILDKQGFIIQANVAAKQILETSLHDQNWSEIVKTIFSPKHDDGLEVSLKSGKRVSLAVSCLPDKSCQIVLIHDQTQTREVQDKLNKQKRLFGIGKMMASLAHQIKTPIATAMLYAGNLKYVCKEEHIGIELINKLQTSLIGLDQLVENMLSLVRKGTHYKDQVKVQDLIDNLLELNQPVLDQAQAILTVNNSLEKAYVVGNEQALISAISNLIVNAIEAVVDNQPKIRLSVFAQGKKVIFKIQDNGPGMSQMVIDKALSEFYSSKPTGTGLGLSIAKVIAEACHGELVIESNSNGTTIQMILNLSNTGQL